MDNPNFDAANNLACYAFSISPYETNPSDILAFPMEEGGYAGLPLIDTVGTGPSQRLRIEFIRRTSPTSGLTYIPQFGNAPVESGPDGFIDATGTPTVEDLGGGWERVIIEDTVTGAAASRRFGRVKVDYTAPTP